MKQPPIKIKCPECRDTGWIKCKIGKIPCKCENAEWNYLTPEQYVEWMRTEGEQPEYEMLDSDPVWAKNDKGNWYLTEIGVSSVYKLIIVARPGQPKPPEEYRP